MYVILTYDVKKNRVPKVMKICRKYLQHVQKSVFEGMITDGKLELLKRELQRTVEVTEDSVCIYEFPSIKYMSKEKIGLSEEMNNII